MDELILAQTGFAQMVALNILEADPSLQLDLMMAYGSHDGNKVLEILIQMARENDRFKS